MSADQKTATLPELPGVLRLGYALERAKSKLTSYSITLGGKMRLDTLERRLESTTRLYRNIIDDELEREGPGYVIAVPLFRTWIRERA